MLVFLLQGFWGFGADKNMLVFLGGVSSLVFARNKERKERALQVVEISAWTCLQILFVNKSLNCG